MSNWKATADMYESLIDKPKMIEKYLAKPPFKYIFDMISEICKKTGFGQGLYEGDELKPDFYGEKGRKITYLNKIISLVEVMEGKKSNANPQKIVAGLEPQHTNELLQSIFKCATSGKFTQAHVKRALGQEAAEQPAEAAKTEKKKIERPPSATKTKKVQQQAPSQQPSKKQLEKHAPVQEQKKQPEIEEPKQAPKMSGPKKGGQQYSKKVKQLMEEGEQQVKKQKEQEKQKEEETNKNNIEMGRLGKKNKKTNENKIISGTGELSQKQLDIVKGIIQSICQNTAPLGKSIEFIHDDIESMNRELQHWRKQYHASKSKMQNELKTTEEALLPIYDKLTQIEQQIKDQKGKIQTARAQIIKNDSTIKELLMSVVTTK